MVLRRVLTLMLEAFRLAHLGVELGPDLVEKLVETGGIPGGHRAHAAMRVHGHCGLGGG